jgi:hypothetical protein
MIAVLQRFAPTMRNRPAGLPRLLAAAAALSLLACPALAEKTDVVVLVNGDHITGEVQELAYGQLKFKTDHMGTIYIEWDKIVSLRTGQLLQLELQDGRRLHGQAPEASAQAHALTLVQHERGRETAAVDVPMPDIVRIATLERGAWYDRLDGSVSVGYNFTAASEVEVFNLAASIGSRTQQRQWSVSLDAQLTDQSEGDSSQRATLEGALERFLPNRYYYETLVGFTRNQELGLDLRSLVGMTFGRYLRQQQGMEWRVGAGLAASAENASDGSRRESLEAQLGTSFRMFRLDSPKTDITVALTLLPSLTESGRVRGEGSLAVRHEVISDLFFEISLYNSYDNEPAAGGTSNDWGIVTSLGYTF